MTKSAIGDRGKWAEKDVEKVLKRMNEQFIGFAYDRQADARAAGGRLRAALCDFLFWWKYDGGCGSEQCVSGLLEVKETKHAYRIAKDKLDQLPRMRKVRHAGGLGVVLIYHSTLDQWRMAPLEFFDGEIPPSWDLGKLPLFKTATEALNSSDNFPYLFV